jgi:catechol 2,3-dioxygenase-like lactoylglutathione lyase family enzyme
MSTAEVRSDNATAKATAAKMDMKFEIVVIPVSDIDRAKEFYGEKLGWRLDADYDNGKDFRVIQYTARLRVFDHLRQDCYRGGTWFRPGLVLDRLRHRGRPQRAAWSRHPDQPGVPRRRRCVRWHGRTIPVWADPGQRSGS